MGLPDKIIQAIRNLCDRNHHIYNAGGRILYAFLSLAGVRQGCPASATIFAWCSQPVLVYLQSNLQMGRTVKGYADDAFLILHDIWNELGHVFMLLEVVARATNLQVNLRKTIIVPLWTCVVTRVREIIGRKFPHLSEIAVAGAAKYLGFWIGKKYSCESESLYLVVLPNGGFPLAFDSS